MDTEYRTRLRAWRAQMRMDGGRRWPVCIWRFGRRWLMWDEVTAVRVRWARHQIRDDLDIMVEIWAHGWVIREAAEGLSALFSAEIRGGLQVLPEPLSLDARAPAGSTVIAALNQMSETVPAPGVIYWWPKVVLRAWDKFPQVVLEFHAQVSVLAVGDETRDGLA